MDETGPLLVLLDKSYTFPRDYVNILPFNCIVKRRNVPFSYVENCKIKEKMNITPISNPKYAGNRSFVQS